MNIECQQSKGCEKRKVETETEGQNHTADSISAGSNAIT